MAVRVPIPSQFTNLDIRDTLNAYGGSVGDISSDYFGDRANINKWAGRKPTWNPNYPSSFGVDRIVTGWKYLKYRKPEAPYRIADYVGYNPTALPCKLNRISIAPTTVTVSGQGVTVFFEWFTGEIDWREYGATMLVFTLTENGNNVRGQIKEVSLDGIPKNGIINNSGQEVFQYSFVGNPGDKRTLGVSVTMRGSDGVSFKIEEAGAVVKLEGTVEYKVNYPTNIIYTYNGKWNTYGGYIAAMPKLPIKSSGELYNDLQIPFNTTSASVLNNFRNSSVFFSLPNGRTITYTYEGETPDQAATKVLMYKKLGSGSNIWDPVTDPYYVTVLG